MANAPDTATVVAHLRDLLAQGRSEEMFAELVALLTQMSQTNTELQLRLAKLLRQNFGRKSEKSDPAQLALFLDSLGEAAKAAEAPELPPSGHLPPAQLKPRRGHGRRPLPATLPVETRVLEAEQKNCPSCGEPMPVIGHECSRMLEFVPAQFRVLELKREKRACPICVEGVVTAPAADKVIDRGLPGPGLLAHLLVSKFADALPLNRLSGIYGRAGVEIAVSSLADWVGGATDCLKPIADEIRRQALRAFLLQTDDTGLKVLDRDAANGIKKGHVWVYVGDGRWAAFVYTPNWKADSPRDLLKDREGYLQHDGYAGYDQLHASDSKIVEVGCLAHFRRGFVEALEGGDSRAAIAVELIRKVYEVEQAAAGATPEGRAALRQEHTRGLMNQLGSWMAETLRREPPKSNLAKAIQYGVNRWQALNRFIEDGRLPPDNNASERALRAIAQGRKNYLFAGSDTGAERAAIAYTLIATCKLNGVEPWAYLQDVLGKIAEGWPQARLSELLPPNWAIARTAVAA